MNDILEVLSYTGFGILFINVIIYFIGFANQSKAYKAFTAYIVTILIIHFFMELYAFQGKNNHFLSNYFLWFHFILLSVFFYYAFKDVNKKIAVFTKYTGFSIVGLLAIQYSITPMLYYNFNSLGFLITSCFIIIYSVCYLYENISNKLPFVYIATGAFLYTISSCLIFVSASQIVSFNDKTNVYIWNINAVLFIVYQLLILWEWKATYYPGAYQQQQ